MSALHVQGCRSQHKLSVDQEPRFFQSSLIWKPRFFAKFTCVLISLFSVTVLLVAAALKSTLTATLAVFLRPVLQLTRPLCYPAHFQIASSTGLPPQYHCFKWALLAPSDGAGLDRFGLAVSGSTLCTAEWIAARSLES